MTTKQKIESVEKFGRQQWTSLPDGKMFDGHELAAFLARTTYQTLTHARKAMAAHDVGDVLRTGLGGYKRLH